jgi:hypothetical protein
MVNKSKKVVLFAALMIGLFIPAIACTVYLGGPEIPGPAITPAGNPEDVDKAWSNAASMSTNGTVVVVFSESELTAYLQQKLNADPNNSLHSVQVFLRDGRIKIYGVLDTGYVSASVLIILRPEVTADYTINLNLEQAQVGPLNLPSGLLSAVSDMLTEALTGEAGTLNSGFQVQEILVGDGQIAIRGTIH